MSEREGKFRIAILGGGPSCLFVLKRLVDLKSSFEVDIFEKKKEVGPGMPYSQEGANREHITNVSDNEIPVIATSIEKWIETLGEPTLKKFGIDADYFNQYKVLPRLFFGKYLKAQFKLLLEEARDNGITVRVHMGSNIVDVIDDPDTGLVKVVTDELGIEEFNSVIICTGHNWPRKNEGKVEGFYDSPYPPSKLAIKINHPVAIKGSSLTAFDAVRTLARSNGKFVKDDNDKLVYVGDEGSEKFKIVMHSRNGLLPAIRFHLREPRLSPDSLLTKEQVEQNRKENGGFLSLDFVFEENFKKGFRNKDKAFYSRIKDMSLEAFVDEMMAMREKKEPFQLFREEYEEAEKSIENRKSIFWKEMLAELSYTINYPAKYFSAEDMLRLKKVLMPLIAVVIAFVPQDSCDELFALYDAGRLEIVSVGSDSTVEPLEKGGAVYKYEDEQGKSHAIRFKTYVDCAGQPHLPYEALPFKSLLAKRSVSQAVLKFKSGDEAEKCVREGIKEVIQNAVGEYFLMVPGIAINDHFQIVNEYGIDNERIFIMAVPYISGYNPDYSGLDFSEQASQCIVEKLSQVLQDPPFAARDSSGLVKECDNSNSF
ncbi:FAD/NAD(P)-binding protein [Dyadobacter sp. CY312]|uniref:FAD/NAD(P)-binding protein n=1 Tax=Dyadobacter sp. CY312 TaxID=2907303 RepID=UPI001F24571F|nr:FAD/NAD(P)-binding protein [Dyadobacter sp. CY312]MCE7042412.1 FAD/NAD(P)-binding protein [Dyadobacter sp. CY312]